MTVLIKGEQVLCMCFPVLSVLRLDYPVCLSVHSHKIIPDTAVFVSQRTIFCLEPKRECMDEIADGLIKHKTIILSVGVQKKQLQDELNDCCVELIVLILDQDEPLLNVFLHF